MSLGDPSTSTDTSTADDWRRRERGIYRILLSSHAAVALILAATMVVVYGVNTISNRYAREISNVDVPTMNHALACLAAIEKSKAALRGWVVIQDPAYREVWEQTWTEEIRPTVDELTRLSASWNSRPDQRELEKFAAELEDLYEIEWWIADVATAEGSQPGELLLRSHCQPSINRILRSVTVMIDEEIAAEEENEQLGLMADLRGNALKANAALIEAHLTGDQVYAAEFNQFWGVAMQRLASIRDEAATLDPDQRDQLIVIEGERNLFEKHAKESLRVRFSDQWNIANYAMDTEVQAAQRYAISILNDLIDSRQRAMESAVAQVDRIGTNALIVTAGLSMVAGLLAWYMARRSAAVIAEPVARLAKSTVRISKGMLRKPIESEGPTEIRMLAGSFDEMRKALIEREAELVGSETRFRATVEAASDAIITTDESGTMTTYNHGAEEMFLFSAKEAVGKNVSMLMPEPDRSRHDGYIKNYLGTGEAKIINIGREVTGMRKDGTTFPMHLMIGHAKTETGNTFIGIAHDITDRIEAQRSLQQSERRFRELYQEYEQLASTDALTGIANRREFDRRLDIEWKRAQRDGQPIGLILIDIDCFKKYNDGYGHQAGDECLRKVAWILAEQGQRAADLLARYGGEEFALIMPNSGSEEVRIVAERLRSAVEGEAIPHIYSTVTDIVTTSLGGYTMIPTSQTDPEDLIEHADTQLYSSKANGRNRASIGHETNSK